MSAVKVTHIPTGMQVCIDGRSQYSNRQDAMSIILSRLKSNDRKIQNNNININRVSQIGNMLKVRTYNFIEDRVKDERVQKKFRTKDIMDGKLYLIYDLLI